jgi:hypothetical protein
MKIFLIFGVLGGLKEFAKKEKMCVIGRISAKINPPAGFNGGRKSKVEG